MWTATPSTGDASDSVTTSGADTIDLGAWTDELYVVGDPTGSRYTGGSDRDDLYINVPSSTAPASWTLNNRTGQLSVDDQPSAEFNGFQHFGVSGPRSFSFVGSPKDEVLSLATPISGFWLARNARVDVQMGGGIDLLNFYGGAPGAGFDGGPGADLIYYYRDSRHLPRESEIFFNLASGALTDMWEAGRATRRAIDFEHAKVFANSLNAGPITIWGTKGPNKLKGVSARSPWDVPVTIYGRGGNDNLMGSRGNDTLVGGAGYDVAIGRSGTDRCQAEQETDCER